MAILETDAAARIYVSAEGTLFDGVQYGATVDEGETVARLVEPRLERELARLEGEVREYRVRLDQLERRRIHDPSVAAQIPTAREAFNDAEQQLIRREQDAERLLLKAPRSGTVIAPPPQTRSRPGSLPGWTAAPLDERNRGCYLTAGTTVCLIGDRSQMVAMLVINQDQVPLIRTGQSVRLQWNELPGTIQSGEIVEVAGLDIDLLTTDLIRRAELPTRVTSSGELKPVGTWYHALVRLSSSHEDLLPGTVGQARILVDPQSLVTQLRRWLGRTFAFGR